MKSIFIFLLAALFAGFAATAQTIQGRLKPGTSGNSVIIALKSNGNLTGQITNVQFVLQIPPGVTPIPSPYIKSNPVVSYVPTGNYLPLSSLESGYRNFLFGATTLGTPTFTFNAGQEVDFLEIAFSGGPTNSAQEVRLAQLPNGGASTQMNFYIEIGGVDRTNELAMFYGTGASNSGSGYGGYSFSPLANIVLPVTWLNFNAVRQVSDVALDWQVANEQNTDRYEVEAGTNGVDFTTIATQKRSAGNGSKSYALMDKGVVRYNSKVLYYRIKQFDADGKYSYSPTKTVRLDVRGETGLYPNPAKEGFTLTIPYLNPDQQKVQLQLVNGLGQIVDQKSITRLQASNFYYNIQSSLIVSGDYLLKIYEDGQLTETKRVSVQK